MTKIERYFLKETINKIISKKKALKVTTGIFGAEILNGFEFKTLNNNGII